MKKAILPHFFIMFFLFFIAFPGYTATYYVSTAGSDLDSGTFGSPWLNISKAAATMTAGDTVYVREGTYVINTGYEISPAHSGSFDKYITFSNYQDENVVLDGTATGVTRPFKLYAGPSVGGDLAYICIKGFTIQNFVYGGIETASSSGSYPHHIEILNCHIKGIASMMEKSAIRLRDAHDIIIAGTTINNSYKGIELNNYTYNIQIIDCLIHDMNQYSTSTKNYVEADGINTAQNYLHDVIIDGCEVYDCQDDGIDLRGHHFTLKHCVSHHTSNPWPGYSVDGHGYKVYALDNPVDPGKYHAEFIRCISYGNSREGFKLSSLPTDAYGGSGTYVKKFRMFNCTAAGDDYGLSLVSNSTHPMDISVKNSILSSHDWAWEITGNPVIWSENSVPVTALPWYLTMDSDYNLHYAGGENEPISYLGSLYSGSDINDSTWYSDTGCGEHSISYDSCFMDESSDDYRLDSNSPCIDAGTDIGLAYAGTAPDMGAFETGTVEVTSPAGLLKSGGECWISIPVAPVNPGPYSVFAGLSSWPNCVYHILYRYDVATGNQIIYPTYQSDAIEFGDIVPGGAYELLLDANNPSITVSGVELKDTCALEIAGSGARFFFFGNPFNETVSWGSCTLDNGSEVKSIDEAISAGWLSSPVWHFNPGTQTWEHIGTTLEPWHVYLIKVSSTPGALELIIPFSPVRSISGTISLENPGYVLDNISIMYQARQPGFPPLEPLYSGTVNTPVSSGNPASSAFTVSGIEEGTYDVAIKCINRAADMAEDVVVAGADVTGLEFTLWAGDGDGDDNYWDAEPGDNDVDFGDYFLLCYQYYGQVPIVAGQNADFDGDGDVDFDDYDGMYEGYINNRDPGNWWF